MKEPINKLTGLPVSEQMLTVLDRLERNEDIPLEEIQKLPEIQEAYSCINNSTPTTLLKNRESLQQGVLEKLLKMGSADIDSNGKCTYNGIVGRNSRIDIVIGLPASGKSSALVEPLSHEYKSRIIDSDEAKKLLPEFNNGWGAGVVHKESKEINQKLILTSLVKKENIVLPVVGSNYQELKNQLTLFRQNGYKVHLHFNDIPRNKALGRMLKRFVDQGRFLDPQLSYKYQDKVNQVYEQLKQEGEIVDGYSKWSNDVKRGEQPKLLETNENDGFFRKKEAARNINGNLRDGNGIREGTYRAAKSIHREPGESNKGTRAGKVSVNKPSILDKLNENKSNIKEVNEKKDKNSRAAEKSQNAKER